MRHTCLLDIHYKTLPNRPSRRICNYRNHPWLCRFSHHNPHSITLFHLHKASNNNDIMGDQVDPSSPSNCSPPPPQIHNILLSIYIEMCPFLKWRLLSNSGRICISLYQKNYCIFYMMGGMLEEYTEK